MRSLVVVDSQRTATAEEADEFIELDPTDFEALWELRARMKGARSGPRPLDASPTA